MTKAWTDLVYCCLRYNIIWGDVFLKYLPHGLRWEKRTKQDDSVMVVEHLDQNTIFQWLSSWWIKTWGLLIVRVSICLHCSPSTWSLWRSMDLYSLSTLFGFSPMGGSLRIHMNLEPLNGLLLIWSLQVWSLNWFLSFDMLHGYIEIEVILLDLFGIHHHHHLGLSVAIFWLECVGVLYGAITSYFQLACQSPWYALWRPIRLPTWTTRTSFSEKFWHGIWIIFPPFWTGNT